VDHQSKESGMTVIAKNIVPPNEVANGLETQYTAVNCRTIIDKCTVMNYTAGAVQVSIHLVPDGDIAATDNTVMVRSIQGGETYLCPEVVGHVLEPGDAITTTGGAASSLVIRASGREIT
jgi:hypothetical protein